MSFVSKSFMDLSVSAMRLVQYIFNGLSPYYVASHGLVGPFLPW